MNRILTGWTLPRLLYFIIGGFIFIQSLLLMEWLGIVAGGYFTAMGLFGFGCASGRCYPIMRNTKGGNTTVKEEDYKVEEGKMQ